jgi:uncharacterized protein YndB with AHSA1/START domain
MTEKSAQHATFVIERTYQAAPARVFKAFADPVAKASWFAGPDEWDKSRQEFDFRVGGRERISGGPPGGMQHVFDACYHDIVPDQRIVFAYDMHIGENKISVSLVTVEIRPEGAGTHLTFTEQGVFLDGYDDAGSRERGTRDLLDKLGASLQRTPAY